MSKYTTGEMAKLCDVSVRTVQYYDARGILVPSELSEGGRRLYSEENLDKMKIICYLREMGFSIDNIGLLFSDKGSDEVIAMLIRQQTESVTRELRDCEEKLAKLQYLEQTLKKIDYISAYSFGDIAQIMKNQKKRKKLLLWMLFMGALMDLIEVGCLIYGIQTGNWIPLIIGIPIVIALGVFISCTYFSRTAYICPHCHKIFKLPLRKVFWANHTPNTRRLVCPNCSQKSFCWETYRDKENA